MPDWRCIGSAVMGWAALDARDPGTGRLVGGPGVGVIVVIETWGGKMVLIAPFVVGQVVRFKNFYSPTFTKGHQVVVKRIGYDPGDNRINPKGRWRVAIVDARTGKWVGGKNCAWSANWFVVDKQR